MTPITRQAVAKVALAAIIMSLSVFSLIAPLRAEPVPEQEVAMAVETWLRQVITDARPGARVARMEPHRADGETVAYVAHLAGGGFCLCGADDLVLPVYLYVPRGDYDAESPDFNYVLYEIKTRLINLRRGIRDGHSDLSAHRTALAERADLWRDLAAGLTPTRIDDRSHREDPIIVKVPMASEWRQGSPYNDDCPSMPGDEPSKVGCTATALTQIMYYWQWPPTGEGEWTREYYYSWRSGWDSEPLAVDPVIDPANPDWMGRLQWTPDDGGQLQISGYWDRSYYGRAKGISDDDDYLAVLGTLFDRLTLVTQDQWADFGATSYDWSIMANTHEDPVDAGDMEVAKLGYHAGIAINTYWGRHSSSANNDEACNALKSYFRYDLDAVREARNIDRMTEEIGWLRPVQMGGATPTGGAHAWIALGYDKSTDPDRLFLMNIGWGGDYIWYACDDIDLGYTENQNVVSRIAPREGIKFVGGGVAGDGTPATPYADLPTALAIVPDGSTLILKAGSVNVFPGPSLVLDRPLVLTGYSALITVE